ncbi:hypothetical protein UFOVP1309_70 [uncultured Caudovirales phage]|uniref:Uncharacterized protein n=1 Tax=uncultured Caudovirales phage TaxID=2100421 RepID=A0A6J5RW01_9CAUD|nr:hypothetical protein UFOVP1309_70 [uncultured Caudovirales phage]
MMTKKEKLQLDTLKAQLAAEQERSEKAIKAYRENLYELVELQIKINRIQSVLLGNE